VGDHAALLNLSLGVTATSRLMARRLRARYCRSRLQKGGAFGEGTLYGIDKSGLYEMLTERPPFRSETEDRFVADREANPIASA